MAGYEGLSSELKEELTLLRKARGIPKRKITLYMQKLKGLVDEALTPSLCRKLTNEIRAEVSMIA